MTDKSVRHVIASQTNKHLCKEPMDFNLYFYVKEYAAAHSTWELNTSVEKNQKHLTDEF